jgi:hypothetical protein
LCDGYVTRVAAPGRSVDDEEDEECVEDEVENSSNSTRCWTSMPMIEKTERVSDDDTTTYV